MGDYGMKLEALARAIEYSRGKDVSPDGVIQTATKFEKFLEEGRKVDNP